MKSSTTFRAAIAGLALALSACADPAAAPKPKDDSAMLDADAMRRYSKDLQQYADAMLLCGSTSAADWEEAKHQFEALLPFFVFQEDPELIRQFRGGSDAARKELARRGVILRSALVLSGAFDRAKWEEARKTLMASGEAGQVLLSTTLLKLLLNGQNQEIWPHIRFMLVESGSIAMDTTIGLARELANQTPPETAVFRIDDLVQVTMVVIGFGDPGRPALEDLARNSKPNVRRSVARAIGESRDGASAPILSRLLDDSSWAVRSAAALAMGQLASARKVAGPALVERLGKERDAKVLRDVLRAIGDLLYIDAIPDLIKVLEVPSRETAEASMQALYILTGEKLLRRDQWNDWYRLQYPEWKRKHAPK